jgi:pyruvate ferredoxin oxidoreductase beta subunit
VVSSSPIRHRVPVTDYLRIQARYAHLFRPAERKDIIARIQSAADRNIARFRLLPEDLLAERSGAHAPGEAGPLPEGT